MTDTEKTALNRRFAGLCGICWHDGQNNPEGYYEISDRKWIAQNPDFCADPRLVLREMYKRLDWGYFVKGIELDFKHSPNHIHIDYILNETGLLCLAACEFMERGRL